MKKVVLICLFVFSFLNVGMKAVNPSIVTSNNRSSNFPHGCEEIVLQGELMYSVGPNAIVAGVGSDAIYIEFSQNLGNVTIILQSESGWAYNTVVNTGVVQLVVIPINNNFSGSYLLEISNATGFAEGSFIR